MKRNRKIKLQSNNEKLFEATLKLNEVDIHKIYEAKKNKESIVINILNK